MPPRAFNKRLCALPHSRPIARGNENISQQPIRTNTPLGKKTASFFNSGGGIFPPAITAKVVSWNEREASSD
jgi:hypothetical protein